MRNGLTGCISDGTLRKHEHILKTKDFRAAYRKGGAARRSGFVLYYLPNAFTHNRLGFSISSSVVRLSSIRNRIRRVFREVYRKRKAAMKAAFDLVVVVRKNPGKKISYEWVENTFLAMAREAGLLA